MEPLRLLALMNCALLTGAAVTYYAYDGKGNNVAHPNWGSTNNELQRFQTPAAYADGISEPSGQDRPNPRRLTRHLELPPGRHKKRSARLATDMLTYIGQFFDHDIDLTPGGSESWPIQVPECDLYYDPECTGTVEIGFKRSVYNASTPATQPRQQLNGITAYIDGSVVYGSTPDKADSIRSFRDGRMLTHDNNMLPFATASMGIAMAADSGKEEVVRAAGDFRANVNPPILALQTLFMREHNRLAAEFKSEHQEWDDERVFQEARKWNVAQMQAICYYEYMPSLGFQLDAYTGYKPNVDASVDNFFSTVSYRYGHSEVGDIILRLDDNGNEIPEGHLPLFEVYFYPTKALAAGIEPILRGMSWRHQMEVDVYFATSVSHYLFGDPGAGGSDLTARNIQRARDHGIPDYNTCRESMGLKRKTAFSEITSDPYVASKLEEIYGSLDDIDPYLGGLAEDHVNDSNLGELFYASMSDQYTRLRDGDRFYFENGDNGLFTDAEVQKIRATGLRDVIMRNTNIKNLPQSLYFRANDDVWPRA